MQEVRVADEMPGFPTLKRVQNQSKNISREAGWQTGQSGGE